MWSQAVVDVCFKISGDVHFIGVWEELGFTVRGDLRKYQHLHVRGGRERETYKAAKDLFACFHGDWSTVVIYNRRSCRLAVGARRAVEADAFHDIVQDLVVSFCSIRLGKTVYLWQVLPAFV